MDHRSIDIALDARTLHRAARRGIGKTLGTLYETVLERRPDWRVLGYHRGPTDRGITSPGYRPRPIDCPGDRLDAWRRWRLPAAAWRDGAALLHCPANLAPSWTPLPTMVTVHDLLPLDQGDATARRLDATIRRCLRHRLPILTPSRFTADRIIARYHAPPDRIAVNPWAADPSMTTIRDPAERRAVAARYGASGPFVLHLGAPDPRKNTVRVIEAFAALPGRLRRHWSLVIVGLNDPGHRRRMVELCRARGVGDAAHLHDYAHESDLPALFSEAGLLLYPSRGEGFGLPILDAFAAGTAVLTSPNTSLSEVGGDAVAYAEAGDTARIADRLGALLDDDGQRQRLVEAGRRRGAAFTWAAAADRFIETVEQTLDRGREVRRHAA